MKLTVNVLTPQSQIFSGEADEVLVPSVSGELGILPNHASLMTQIEPGELIIKTGAKNQSIAIMGGYIEVNNNIVNILGDFAIRAEDIEVAKVEQAKQKALKAKEERISQEDLVSIEADLRRSLLELKVAERRKTSR